MRWLNSLYIKAGPETAAHGDVNDFPPAAD